MKVKTSAERDKKYRESLKLPGNEEKFLKITKEKQAARKSYHQKMLFSEKSTEYKKKRSEAVKKSRMKKSQIMVGSQFKKNSDDDGFKSKKGLKKAVTKIKKSLPKSKGKAVEAVQVVLKDLDMDVETQNTKKDPKITRDRLNFSQTSKSVQDFFESDAVSRQMPGKKDVIKVKSDSGIIEALQKRSMLMTVEDAYDKFKAIYSETQVSRAKFYKLKPANIVLISNISKDICLCSYCENFNFLFNALRPYFLLDDIGNLKDFLRKFSCSSQFDCASSTCMECYDFESMLDQCLKPFSDDKPIKWTKWVKIGNFFQKEQLIERKLSDAIEEFSKTFKYFKLHMHLIQIQNKVVSSLKKETDHTKAVIQMDYSENFSTFSQGEIQSAHFNRRQISIFTASVTINKTVMSYAIVNDDLSHSKVQVLYYIEILIQEIKKKFSELKHAEIVTDGCACQFKNKFILTNLLYMESDFGITAKWHFMPTSHGKSAADGIGGTLKRQVSDRIKTGTVEINSAADFVNCAKSFVQNINVILATKSGMEIATSFIKDRWENVKGIPGTQSMHFFEALERNRLLGAVTSNRDNAKIFTIS